MNEQPIQIIPSAVLDRRYVTRNFLASNENLKGASLVGIEDASSNFTGTTVEAALAELANRPISHSSSGYAANVYLTNTNSSVSGYKVASYTNDIAETIVSKTVNNNELLIYSYLFDLPLGVTYVDGGAWKASLYSAIDDAAGDSYLKFEIYLRHTDNTETALFSAYSSTIENRTGYEGYQRNEIVSIQPGFIVDSTDKIGVRIYAKTTAAGERTLYYKIGGGNSSYINTPLSIRHSQLRGLNDDLNIQHITSLEKSTISTGWISTLNQPTYVGSESNGRVYSVSLSIQDALDITVGDRVRLINTVGGFQYFIVHAKVDTSVSTLYLFGNGTMTNSAITGFSYSHCKFPTGFPTNISNWSITYTYSTMTGVDAPTQYTWYNNGSSYSFPRGSWDIDIKTTSNVERTNAGWISSQVGIFTTATPSGTPQYSYLANKFAANNGAGAIRDQRVNIISYRGFSVSSPTTYYLCQRTYDTGNIYLRLQQDNIPTVVTIISSYL